MAAPPLPPDAIAIVGAAGRLPGASDLDAFRDLLRRGGRAMRPVDPALLAASPHAAVARRSTYVAMTSTMDHVDVFDAGFFGLTPREALLIDPQQRQILECAWLAFENAGIVPGDGDQHRTAVFTSVAFSSYLSHFLLPRLQAGQLDVVEVGLSNNVDYAPARVAHKLNLKGPSIAVQTACSSSLVATHLACRSLVEGECDLALVAASSITVPNGLGYPFTDKGMVSSDGLCRAFARNASGTIFANGAAALLLRRLDDAESAGDRILGILRGSAVNNDGGQRAGFTAPNVDGQSAVIAEALHAAEVDGRDVSYIEAHGTATPLGDPIEIAALQDAYDAGGDLPRGDLPIGACKANVGHLDTVAGLAGLIKILIAFEGESIPPTPFADDPNPALGLDQTPFRLVPRAAPWPRGQRPRIAGLSSFGMGGSNAHAILQEPPPPPHPGPARTTEMLVFSGRDDQDAAAVGRRLGAYLRRHPEVSLADVAHTLRVGRRAFPNRRSLTASSAEEAARALMADRWDHRSDETDGPAKVAFVFPGQGSQYPGLGARLAADEPAFRHHRDRLHRQIRACGGPDLDTAITPAQAQDTTFAQPLLFVTGVALGQTLRDLGLSADVLIGHSVGEIAVACLGGALLEDHACRLVVARAAAMAQAPTGALAMIRGSADAVTALISTCALATPSILAPVAFNAPNAVVVGGTQEAVATFLNTAEAAGHDAIRLNTSHAFHTPLMARAAETVAGAAADLAFGPLRHPGLSTVTGLPLAPDAFSDPAYWARQILNPVRFADAIGAALDDGVSLFMEVGPPGGLASFLPAIAAARAHQGRATAVPLLSHPHDTEDPTADSRAFLGGLGALWGAGRPIDWGTFDAPFLPRTRLALPGYPFKAERHWPEAASTPASDRPSPAPLPDTAATGGPAAIEDDRPPQPDHPLLPRQSRPAHAPPATAVQGPIESALAALWEDLLLIAPIGREDDFIGLGGTSITALQLVQALSTQGYRLTVREVFDHRVLKALAAHIAQAAQSAPHQDTAPFPAARPDPPCNDAPAFDDDVLSPDILETIQTQLDAVPE